MLPDGQERRVIARLYEDAQRLRWTYLTHADRTRQYAYWIKDPEVGGVLTSFMDPEEARVWIKDGPMKEYARAIAGIGKYADLVTDPRQGAAAIVQGAMGEAWSVVPGTLDIKPLRCVAACQDNHIRVFWGPARDFKHLLFAGLEATDGWGTLPAILVVTDSIEMPVSAGEREQQQRLADRCGLRLSHLRV